MKKTFFIFLLLGGAFTSLSQNIHEIHAEPGIESVVVFLNGAELRSNLEVDVRRGVNVISIHGLSPHMEPGSVQFSVNGDYELSSLSVNEYQVDLESIIPSIRVLRDSIISFERNIEGLNNQIDAFDAEKSLLKENQKLGNPQVGVTTSELMKAADFYRERTLLINNAVSKVRRRLNEMDIKLAEIKLKAEKLEKDIDTKRKEIVLVVNSPSAQKLLFNIRYLTGNSGWSPTYDIIAKDISNPVELKYKAEIYNNTAIDWKSVKVKLSTADPTLGASRPYLTTWNLNYTTAKANEGLLQRQAPTASSGYVEANDVEYEDVAVSELSAEFPIENLQTIPSGIKPLLVDVTSYTLPSAYEYLSIPKVDQSAFLVAKVVGWEKLNLIDGSANVYFGDNYIGQSTIATKFVSDTLDLSLGRDRQIQVLRTKIEDKSGNNFIGTRRSESFTYEINIKNNRKSPVSIKIQDQIPISQESDISVDVLETSGATLEPASGRLQWIKNLSSGEGVKILLSFEVKYPKNKNVVIRKDRYVRTPRFKH